MVERYVPGEADELDVLCYVLPRRNECAQSSGLPPTLLCGCQYCLAEQSLTLCYNLQDCREGVPEPLRRLILVSISRVITFGLEDLVHPDYREAFGEARRKVQNSIEQEKRASGN